MVFKANIPNASDFLADSQGDLKGNNQQLDASFLVDHYTFSDLTSNNGKHNQVTTPLIVGGVHPNSTVTDMKFYAMQDTAEIGLLQYSRGWDTANSIPAQPSPLTFLQSPIAPITLTNGVPISLLDFTNINNYAECKVYFMNRGNDGSAGSEAYAEYGVVWKGNGLQRTFLITEIVKTNFPTTSLTSTTTVLQILKTSGSVVFDQFYWTIQFIRIQP